MPDMREDKPKEQAPKEQAPKDTRTTDQRIADLELQLAQTRAGTPLGTMPHHAGGPDDEVAETWSQAEQERSRAEADEE